MFHLFFMSGSEQLRQLKLISKEGHSYSIDEKFILDLYYMFHSKAKK